MSHAHDHVLKTPDEADLQAAAAAGVEPEDLDLTALWKNILVIIGGVVVLIIIGMALAYGRTFTMLGRAENINQYAELQAVKTDGQALLSGYAVVSAENGVFRMPIDRAMDQVAARYAQLQQGQAVVAAPQTLADFNLAWLPDESAVQTAPSPPVPALPVVVPPPPAAP